LNDDLSDTECRFERYMPAFRFAAVMVSGTVSSLHLTANMQMAASVYSPNVTVLLRWVAGIRAAGFF
jgi:hypothetical protein